MSVSTPPRCGATEHLVGVSGAAATQPQEAVEKAVKKRRKGSAKGTSKYPMLMNGYQLTYVMLTYV